MRRNVQRREVQSGCGLQLSCAGSLKFNADAKQCALTVVETTMVQPVRTASRHHLQHVLDLLSFHQKTPNLKCLHQDVHLWLSHQICNPRFCEVVTCDHCLCQQCTCHKQVLSRPSDLSDNHSIVSHTGHSSTRAPKP